MKKVITAIMILSFMTLISGCFPPGQLNPGNGGNGNGNGQMHQLDRNSMMQGHQGNH